MTLSDFANFATVISGLAVLISLVYLSLQIRQNTLAHRAAAYQGRRAFTREHVLLGLDPATARLILRGNAGDKTMTEAENFQYMAYVTSFFLGMDELFWLHSQRILDQDVFDSQVVVLAGYMRQPGPRTVWQAWKPRATPVFRNHVDAHMAEYCRTPGRPFQEYWELSAATAATEHARHALPVPTQPLD